MGDAFTAVADDASAASWNPAGLGRIRNAELSLTYDRWFVDSYFQHLMGNLPVSAGTLGMDIFYMNYGSFDRVDDKGAAAGAAMHPYDFECLAAYGIQFGKQFSAGIGLRFLDQSLDTGSSIGFAGDIGLKFSTGIFSAGLSAQNIGTFGEYPLPLSVRLGTAIEALKLEQHSLLTALDIKYTANDMPSVCAGVEYTFMNMASARCGYRVMLGQDNLTGLKSFTAGAGIKLGSFGFDYAFAPYGDLGMSHRVAVSYAFKNAEEPQAKLKPREKAAASAQVHKKSAQELYDMLAEAGTMENAGKLKDAEHKYSEIIGYDKNYADAYKRLGAVYYKEGKKAEAVAAFQLYLKLKPDDRAVSVWLKKHINEK